MGKVNQAEYAKVMQEANDALIQAIDSIEQLKQQRKKLKAALKRSVKILEETPHGPTNEELIQHIKKIIKEN